MHKLRRDEGFTLIELLLAVVILGIISVPLANMIIVVLANTDNTSDRLALSHDAQISATYFGEDVASMGVRDYSTLLASGAQPFKTSVQINAPDGQGGSNCTMPVSTAVVRLLSDDWQQSGGTATVTTDIVAYYLNGTELHRIKCTGGSSTPISDIAVAHYVKPGTVSVNASGTSVSMSLTASKGHVADYPISLSG